MDFLKWGVFVQKIDQAQPWNLSHRNFTNDVWISAKIDAEFAETRTKLQWIIVQQPNEQNFPDGNNWEEQKMLSFIVKEWMAE